MEPAEARFYDMTPEEVEADRRYLDELVERMLYAELHPTLEDFFRRKLRSTMRNI